MISFQFYTTILGSGVKKTKSVKIKASPEPRLKVMSLHHFGSQETIDYSVSHNKMASCLKMVSLWEGMLMKQLLID